jgi:hypothetical protein
LFLCGFLFDDNYWLSVDCSPDILSLVRSASFPKFLRPPLLLCRQLLLSGPLLLPNLPTSGLPGPDKSPVRYQQPRLGSLERHYGGDLYVTTPPLGSA